MENREELKKKVISPIMKRYEWKTLNDTTMKHLKEDFRKGINESMEENYKQTLNSLVLVDADTIVMEDIVYRDYFQSILTVFQMLFTVKYRRAYKLYVHYTDHTLLVGTVLFEKTNSPLLKLPMITRSCFTREDDPDNTVVYELKLVT